MNPAFFIVGCPRSGTTLLGRMADAHPDLAVFWRQMVFEWELRPAPVEWRTDWRIAASEAPSPRIHCL
jgi:hypothetical protein